MSAANILPDGVMENERINFPFRLAFYASITVTRRCQVALYKFTLLRELVTVILMKNELSYPRFHLLEEHTVTYNMLVCTVCQGTGWRVLHRQGDSVMTPEEYRKCIEQGVYPVPCFYAATTYVTCECRFIRPLPLSQTTCLFSNSFTTSELVGTIRLERTDLSVISRVL